LHQFPAEGSPAKAMHFRGAHLEALMEKNSTAKSALHQFIIGIGFDFALSKSEYLLNPIFWRLPWSRQFWNKTAYRTEYLYEEPTEYEPRAWLHCR
jgi:hypothetical protein